MLESISWQNFLTTVALVVSVYYLVSTLLLYNKEILFTFKRNPSQVEEDSLEAVNGSNLLGKVLSENSINSSPAKISTEEISFQFSPAGTQEAFSPPQSDTLMIGTIADLLQEAKALTEVVHGHSKEEAVALFKSLLARYPYLASTQYQQAISIHICTTLKEQGFDLQPNDVDRWWAENSDSINHINKTT